MKRSLYFNSGLVLFIALVILWIPWLGETLFYSKGEPREAIVAVSMLQSGDWILPVSGGCEIPYKPPFLAWIIAVLAKLLNGGEVNEFIARLPSALAAIALVMTGFSWARKERGDRFAIYMSLILATSVEFYRAAMACRVDMVLTACMVGAIYLLYQVKAHEGSDNFWRYSLAAILLSCATLTKGPVGALLPCLVIGLYYLFRGEKFLPTLGRMAALCIASFIIPAVWYYFAWRQGGPDFLQLVWEENFQRLAGTMPYSSHVKPFWYNFVTIIVGMLPWTLLVVMSLWAWGRLWRQPLKPAGILALTAALTVIIFYCIPSSKRSVYLLPAYPFMAYGVAVIAETVIETRVNSAFARVMAVLGILGPAVIVATQFYPVMEFSFEPLSWWSYVLLALPVIVSVGVLMEVRSTGPLTGACAVIWTLLVAYGGAVMPSVMNPLSDKDDARMLMSMADGRQIYAVGETAGHRRMAYALNYYMDDRLRNLPRAADADTCPAGTILVFSNLADTAGLPATYHLTLLKDRLSDTRRAALFAIQTGAPVARRLLDTLADTLVRELPAPAAVEHRRVSPSAPDTTAVRRVVPLERDSAASRSYLTPSVSDSRPSFREEVSP